ncbi:L-seryl-tRNA(Sec) selenium transferase [Desulfitobacterium sp.]|uniref:L-seryl-tRNA(Sec) selenium transferase n=1 Tax=Desulfitobacterium sp. TaxID=49981 RepID=UPI003A522790
MLERTKALLRALPAVHEVQARLETMEEFTEFLTNDGDKRRLTQVIRESVQKARHQILMGQDEDLEESELWPWILRVVRENLRNQKTSLKRIINATGVVLHTNCGRALLAPEVAEFVAQQAQRYSNLELNVQTGERGSRYVHVEKLLCELSGAEAAMVVNNNAAAVLLVVNTFALNQEVIVSRGELVEIGGSFRIPEVLKAGGAQLVEVGATNRTWLQDYEEAIRPETGMLFKAHTSNYRIEGFTHSVSGQELAELGQKYRLPVVEDLGSGSFKDGTSLGFYPEPTIAQSVQAGISLVTFSGDKLLGGPQAGIIVGKRELIEKLKKNQLTRALRIDKLTLAALEGTLRLYERGETDKIPVWRMLSKPETELRAEAELLKNGIEELAQFKAEVQADFSQVGGGAFPTEELPTWVCGVQPQEGTVEELEAFLRTFSVPILTRIKKDWILFDPRTLLAGDREEIMNILGQWKSPQG